MKKLNTEDLIKKLKIIHPTFDFSDTVYKNSKTKITYKCSTHGNTQGFVHNLLKGHGCKRCSASGGLTSKKEYLEKLKLVFKDKYDFLNINNNTTCLSKIECICKKHGIFFKDMRRLLKGKGCQKCIANYMSTHPNIKTGWTYTDWRLSAEKSKRFDSFKVYIIKCWNDNEEFYKIGKTYLTLKDRFSQKSKMPYNYELVKIVKGKAKEISELEKELQRENIQYQPKIKFDGWRECFLSINSLQ